MVIEGRDDASASDDMEQAIRADPDLEPLYFKARLPKPATPFQSLLQGLKLMPEDVASSDWDSWSKALEELVPRERLILEGRHGLGGKRRQTLQALGARFGVTREWVRQLELRAHRHLRKHAVERRLIHEGAPNRLSYFSSIPYWPAGTTRGTPRA